MKQSHTFLTEYQFFFNQYLNLENEKYKYIEKSNENEAKLINHFIEFSKLFKNNDLKVKLNLFINTTIQLWISLKISEIQKTNKSRKKA